ncbi:citrate/2-methylcitrate synthase [Methanolobus profundi]|uniref:Citrate synthase n=1 Tax=Methanolobus profundi TaxID=487685 RepID=A0A1I4RTQ6_9EURY|nr:citrate/2-methylcitrate synthase [Methanolobus profundi]SFM55646.1 citrate synthase [Methanolobus profundi]
MEEMKKGLEGVVALDTKISYIDGIQGILMYRGVKIEDLVDLPYDAVSYLLINGKIPNESELSEYSQELKDNRIINGKQIDVLKEFDFGVEALDGLRTAISCTAHFDLENNHHSPDANKNKTIKLVAKFPTIVAALHRASFDKEPIEPKDDLSHGANFLYMLTGKIPTDLEAEAMEKDLILSAEHELNPSTFSLRIAASTLSDLYSAVICGLCTLKGPLHGGARKGVMDMLDEVGNIENARPYVLNKLERKEKIMGFGHRVYKTYDPRARIYKDVARRLSIENGDTSWFDLAEELENILYHEFVEIRGKPIYPNVDFYSAVVYKYLNIPAELATSIFAMGRVSGWIAHCMEQYADNRVIRPRAHFV